MEEDGLPSGSGKVGLNTGCGALPQRQNSTLHVRAPGPASFQRCPNVQQRRRPAGGFCALTTSGCPACMAGLAAGGHRCTASPPSDASCILPLQMAKSFWTPEEDVMLTSECRAVEAGVCCCCTWSVQHIVRPTPPRNSCPPPTSGCFPHRPHAAAGRRAHRQLECDRQPHPRPVRQAVQGPLGGHQVGGGPSCTTQPCPPGAHTTFLTRTARHLTSHP